MHQSPIKKCADVVCTKSFRDHKWGRIRSWTDGWYHARNGVDSYCPDHVPSHKRKA